MMRRFLFATTVLSAGVAALVGSTGSNAFAATPAPRVTVTPASVMVNTPMKVSGRHFPANSTLTIEECSAPFWIVPKNPCATTNVIHVRTNAKGAFSHKMTAVVCPGGVTGQPGFAETCYVGEPVPTGIDTVSLLGAAKITVTGP
jgi:hypothetical protein